MQDSIETVRIPKQEINESGDVVINIYNGVGHSPHQKQTAPPRKVDVQNRVENSSFWNVVIAILLFVICSTEPVSSYLNIKFLLNSVKNIELNSVKNIELNESNNSITEEQKVGEEDEKKRQGVVRDLPFNRSSTPQSSAKEFGDYRPKLSRNFLTEVKKISKRLDIPPEYLLAVMGFETGGRFSPSYKNKVSGATGLIQFMPKTAKGLGTTTSNLAKLTAIQQLKYVEKYFNWYKSKLNQNSSLEDVYMAVLFPKAIDYSETRGIFDTPIQYRQNRGLDANKDRKVTKKEAADKVRGYLPPKGFFDNY